MQSTELLVRGVTLEHSNLDVSGRENNSQAHLVLSMMSYHSRVIYWRSFCSCNIAQDKNATTSAQEIIQRKCGWHTHRIINMHCVQMDKAVTVTPDTRLNGRSPYGQTHTQQNTKSCVKCDNLTKRRIQQTWYQFQHHAAKRPSRP